MRDQRLAQHQRHLTAHGERQHVARREGLEAGKREVDLGQHHVERQRHLGKGRGHAVCRHARATLAGPAPTGAGQQPGHPLGRHGQGRAHLVQRNRLWTWLIPLDTGLTRDLVYLFCGPLSLLFFFNALIFVANALCNNLGAAFQSTLVNWGRHTLGTVPFALWLAMYWGPQGVLIGQAVGGIVFGILAVFLALRVIDRRAATF